MRWPFCNSYKFSIICSYPPFTSIPYIPFPSYPFSLRTVVIMKCAKRFGRLTICRYMLVRLHFLAKVLSWSVAQAFSFFIFFPLFAFIYGFHWKIGSLFLFSGKNSFKTPNTVHSPFVNQNHKSRVRETRVGVSGNQSRMSRVSWTEWVASSRNSRRIFHSTNEHIIDLIIYQI